jgi:hypothetical protein
VRRIDQQQVAGLDAPVRFAGDTIVHDGAVRAGARNRRERDVFQRTGLASERFQRLDGVDLGELA